MKKFILVALTGLCFQPLQARAESGCTLLVDNADGKVISKQGDDCDKRFSPASTFKIALALIGFESGILTDAHNPAWEFKSGYTVNKPDNKQTTDPTLWEKNSVVWYSQTLTTQLGMDKFQKYVDLLNYGNRDLSGDKGKDNGLTHAWLTSSLQISPVEEADFIRNILNRKYALAPATFEKTEQVLPVFETANGWIVHGKTGSTPMKMAKPHGWFVGWAEKGDRKIAFAKLVLGDKAFTTPGGLMARDEFLKEFPQIVE